MISTAPSVPTAAPHKRLMAIPLKIGSSRIATAPAIKVNDVIKIGRMRISAPLTAASFTGTPDATSIFTNSTIRIDCRTMIPPRAIMPIIDVAVNSEPWNQCPVAIPIIVIGIGDMIRPAKAKSRNSHTIKP